jgi:hypothetical protein
MLMPAAKIDAFRDTFGAPFARTKLPQIIPRKKKGRPSNCQKAYSAVLSANATLAAPARNRERGAAMNGALMAMQPPNQYYQRSSELKDFLHFFKVPGKLNATKAITTGPYNPTAARPSFPICCPSIIPLITW